MLSTLYLAIAALLSSSCPHRNTNIHFPVCCLHSPSAHARLIYEDVFPFVAVCWTLQSTIHFKKNNLQTFWVCLQNEMKLDSLHHQWKWRESWRGHLFSSTFVMSPHPPSKRILSAGCFILEGIRALVLCSCRGSGKSGGLGFLPVSLCPWGLSSPNSPPPPQHSCIFLCTAVTHRHQNYFRGLSLRSISNNVQCPNKPQGGEVVLT